MKGNLRVKLAHYDGDTYAFSKDSVTTIITQTMATVAKPCKASLKAEFLAAQAIKIVMTSAQTANKTLSIFGVG